MEKIRRKKAKAEIRKAWEEVMIPLEQVIEKRIEILRQFAQKRVWETTINAERSGYGIGPLDITVYTTESEGTFMYGSRFFLPTSLDSEYYEECRKNGKAWEEFCENGGPFGTFFAEFPLKGDFFSSESASELRKSHLDEYIRASMGYALTVEPNDKEAFQENPMIRDHMISVVGINYRIEHRHNFSIREMFPSFSWFGGNKLVACGHTEGHGKTIPYDAEEFLRRNPDEDPQLLRENLDLLERVYRDYKKLTKNEEARNIFRGYDENPLENTYRIRDFLSEAYPDTFIQMVPYLIAWGTERASEQIKRKLCKKILPKD